MFPPSTLWVLRVSLSSKAAPRGACPVDLPAPQPILELSPRLRPPLPVSSRPWGSHGQFLLWPQPPALRSRLHRVSLGDWDPDLASSCPLEPSGPTYGLSRDVHCSLWRAVRTPPLPSAPGQQRAPGPQTKSWPLSAPPRQLSASHPGRTAGPAGPGARLSRGLALPPVQTGQSPGPRCEHSRTLEARRSPASPPRVCDSQTCGSSGA